MKILMANSFYYPNEIGGAERSVRILAEEFVRKGHDVSVLCLGLGRAFRELNGVSVIETGCINVYTPSGRGESRAKLTKMLWHFLDSFNPFAVLRYMVIFRAVRPDVLHTNNVSGLSCAIWLAAKWMRIPTVHTARDFYLICASSTMMRDGNSCESQCSKCKSFTSVKRWSARSIPKTVHISNFMRMMHSRSNTLVGGDARVIYNPFVPAVRRQGIPEEVARSVPVVGYLGRLDPAKGIEIAIDAVANLHERMNLSFLVAGEGDAIYVDQLKAKNEGKRALVRFVGKVDSESFLRGIDVLLVPSIWNEPLGRVVLEAFAAGVPVVVTPVGGLPEVAKGYAAVVAAHVDATSVEQALAAMLDRLTRDPNGVRAAALDASVNYTPSAIADQYLGVFADAISEAKN